MATTAPKTDTDRSVAPKSASTGFPNRELVVYALALLGGESRRLHTEDVAKKCYELFPASFSWTRYPEFPDKDIVRVALTDARKDKYGALVDGRSGEKQGQFRTTQRSPVSDGWTLTEAGVAWIKENEIRLEVHGGTGSFKSHRQRVLKQLSKVRKHSLYLSYLNNKEEFTPSIGDIAALVRCRVDAPREVWMARFSTIENRAKVADQETIIDFIQRCQDAYEDQR